MKDSVILFSHGSLLCGAGQALEEHARRLRQSGRWARVEIGYLNYSAPSFREAVSRVTAAGARKVVIVPYFLVPGKFAAADLPEEVEAARKEWPQLEIVVAEAIGFDDALADAVLELAEEADDPGGWRADLERAAAHCRSDPRCPLYGSARCPGRLMKTG